jgi:outer membrane protein
MKRFLPVAAALLLASSPAGAQDSEDLRVRVGLGAQIKPKFIGADKLEVAPLWNFDIARGTKPFGYGVPGDSFGLPIISKGAFSAGPAANLRGSRKDSDVGAPVGKVPTTFEVGVFAKVQASKSVRIRGELLKGIGGHEGLVGSVGPDHVWRDGDRYVVSLGPRVLFSDARYQRAYFGVSEAAAAATGLPVYRPGGGVHAVALASGLSYQFNPRWGLFGFARYERLVGDAAKSPIVRELGSRNQVSAGIGLSYTFNINL